jgi:DNA end-binding protein Ku
MPSRSFWKGHLKLSLVTCQVALQPATSTRRKLRFHTINRETGNRIESLYVDEQTAKPVPQENQRKAYPRGPDDLVILEDKELEAVALESTRIIDIETFVAQESIPWIWLDRPYYLLPDAKVAEDAYGVIRDAMAATGTVGIARLVLFRRERAVMLAPRDKGIILWALRYGDEVRDAEEYFADIDPTKLSTQERTLFKALVAERMQDWSDEMVQDPVQKRLKAMIAARKRKAAPGKSDRAGGRGSDKGAKAPAGDNVVSITEALRQSLRSETAKKK